jgi:hypothetical protein
LTAAGTCEPNTLSIDAERRAAAGLEQSHVDAVHVERPGRAREDGRTRRQADLSREHDNRGRRREIVFDEPVPEIGQIEGEEGRGKGW